MRRDEVIAEEPHLWNNNTKIPYKEYPAIL
jgi:hypothetical protein